MASACGLNCDLCPAAARCGKTPNFCRVGHRDGPPVRDRCTLCLSNPLLRMDVRQAVTNQLGGLHLTWPRPIVHHQPVDLPVHLPVLIQAYADPVDIPWVALQAGRVFGVTGSRITPKHHRPLREVYRLGPATKLALECFVEDRVLEGLWLNRRAVIQELRALGFDLILAPNFSVWYDHSRFEQLIQQRRSFIFFHELIDYVDSGSNLGWLSPHGWVSRPLPGGLSMRIQRSLRNAVGDITVELLDGRDEAVLIVDAFLRHLRARGCSPNTCLAYAYDLAHFWRFLEAHGESWQEFTAPKSLLLLEYLRGLASRGAAQRLGLALLRTDQVPLTTNLAPATINRIVSAVSSFFEFVIVSGELTNRENPIARQSDTALARVSERHRPFMGSASRQRPVRRGIRVKTAIRLPRPLSDEQVAALLGSLVRERDRTIFLLMLDGGLRPGEVLNLHLEDINYGRRRVVVRHRTDHPKGARTKSRIERLVDLFEPRTLATLSSYVMRERPKDADSSFVFLVGGRGTRRAEPLSYQALARLFKRRCLSLGMHQPWITPHTLRHTHATKMWEGGMRELTLQKRLGHASPESTRLYTRVSDPAVVADYNRAIAEVGP